MGLATLSSRAVIGEYYRRLEQNVGAAWVDPISNYFTSNQASETYAFLGQSPAMRQWVGGRAAKGWAENGISVENKHYEATLEVQVKDMRRDKTGQVMARIQDLADRTNAHWASLLSTLMLNAPTTVCYDGQYFFDTDHTEGNNTTSQSNSITHTLSGSPVATAGSTTAPSVETMQVAIYKGVQAIVNFKDNENEPMNEGATQFLAMVPPTFMQAGLAAAFLGGNARAFATQTGLDALAADGMSIRVVANPRLSAWTTKFAVFRTDSTIKPFIRQEEMGVSLKAKAEGSEFEFDTDMHQYGVDTWRNVAYGYWQHACLVTLA